MPKDYSKALIYKLCCNDVSVTEIYIGSTIAFRKRKSQHKYDCNHEKCKGYNYRVYQFIRANGGFENWDMVLVEEYTACLSELQLHARERWYIEQLKSSLNCSIPTQTCKEWREINNESITIEKKEWYKKNKDSILQQLKEDYIVNKDALLQKCKDYRNTHKTEIAETTKIYREINKDKIALHKAKLIVCECGATVTQAHLSRHAKTKLHIENMI
jgi:hypothetical protein